MDYKLLEEEFLKIDAEVFVEIEAEIVAKGEQADLITLVPSMDEHTRQVVREIVAIGLCQSQRVKCLAIQHPKERVRKKNVQRAHKEYLRRVKRGG